MGSEPIGVRPPGVDYPQPRGWNPLAGLAQRGQALISGFLPETRAIIGPSFNFSAQPVAAAPTVATAAYPTVATTGVQPQTPPPRQIYVLHSGMNDPTNSAAGNLRQQLLNRGVPAENIIVLDNPYPSFSTGGISTNVDTYNNSADPNSPAARQAYQRLLEALQRNGVRPTDQLVWIGHSAGGQMGLTMAEMAGNDQEHGYRLGTVITLGSPILRNRAPRETRVINFVSHGDDVLNMTTGFAAQCFMGRTVHYVAPNRDDNDETHDMPNIGHSDWTSNPQVMDRILADTQPPAANPGFFSRFFGQVGQLFRGNPPSNSSEPHRLTIFSTLGMRLRGYFNQAVGFFRGLFGGQQQPAPQS